MLPPHQILMYSGLRLKAHRGFALVLSLVFMAFIVVLLMSLTTLVRIEVSASADYHKELSAREQAKLGLYLAIGKLQESTGNDRRVTGSASFDRIFSEAGVPSKNLHWTGVWMDGRSVEDLETEPEVSVENLGWLVSGEAPEPSVDLSARSDAVRLFPVGSQPSDLPIEDQVFAELTPVNSNNTGHFAFWVADEGVKARWNLKESDDLAEMQPTDNEFYLNYELPQHSAAIETAEFSVTDVDDYEKLLARGLSNRDLAFLDAGLPKELFHAFTTSSLGLLTDTRHGGNRWDLSYFIAQAEGSVVNPETGLALDDTQLIKYRDNEPGEPTLKLIRSFLSPDLGTDGESITVRPHDQDAQKHGFHPLLAAFSYYVDFTLSGNKIHLQLYPTLILWNPYNQPLAEQDYRFSFLFAFDYSLRVRDQELQEDGTLQQTMLIDLASYNTITGPGGLGQSEGSPNPLSLNIKNLSFEPGEVVFCNLVSPQAAMETASDGNLMEANDYDAVNDQHFIYMDTGITLPTVPQNPELGFGFIRWDRVENWWPMNASLYLVDDSSEEVPDELIHHIPAAIATSQAGSMNADRTAWSFEEIRPVYFPLTGEAYRGRIPDASMTGPQANENKYNHDYAFRGPLADSQRTTIRYLADYNYRASEIGTYLDTERNWEAPYVGSEGLLAAYQGYRSDKFQHAFIINNLADPGHPINFLGPFFEVPVGGAPLSLGTLQSVNWTDYLIHPSFAFGNSLASPFLSRDSTSASPANVSRKDVDISFMLNETLWDRYYFSGFPQTGISTVNEAQPLDNSRFEFTGENQLAELALSELQSLEGFAENFAVKGAFNINSTNPDAWEMLLRSYRDVSVRLKDGSVEAPAEGSYRNPYARGREPLSGAVDPVVNSQATLSQESYTGFRSLTDLEVRSLAEELSRVVKERGPFVSMAHFVNRALANNEDGLMGAIQEAIDASGINDAFNDEALWIEDGDEITQIPEHKEGPIARNLPGFLTQADVLNKLGPVLTARSDTFRIRAYGSVTNPVDQSIQAEAFCEALVQRKIEPMQTSGDPHQRPYEIVSFRWITDETY